MSKVEILICDKCGSTEDVQDVFDGHLCENCIELEKEQDEKERRIDRLEYLTQDR